MDVRNAIAVARAWVTCLEQGGHRVSLGGKLRKLVNDSSNNSPERWRDIKVLACTLRGAKLADRRPWQLKEPTLVSRLASALRHAQASAVHHLRTGGKMAHVFVGHFNFPILASGDGGATGPIDGFGNHPLPVGDGGLWNVSSLIRLSPLGPLFDGKGRNNGGRRCRRGGPGRGHNSGGLRVRLALQGSRALLSATQDGAYHPEPPSKQALSIDIHSLSPTMLLHSQGTVVTVGGPWRRVQGISAPAALEGTHSSLQEVLRAGLRCVICVQDAGVNTGADPAFRNRSIHALQLEVVAGCVNRLGRH